MTFKPRLATLAVAIALTAFTGTLTACGDKDPSKANPATQQQMPPTTVEVQVVELGTLPIIETFSGRVTALETSEVRPQATGIIDEILFQEGSMVKEGQPLYRINTDSYASSVAANEAALNQARANIGTARANIIAQQALYDKAQADLARYKGLLEVDAISQQMYDQAITNVKTTKAGLEQARANLASSEAMVRSAEAGVNASRLDLSRTIVRAPISGKSGISGVTKGALVANGQATPLVTISRLDPIYVDITQSSSELLKLRQRLASGGGHGSAEVQLVLEDGTPYPLLGQLTVATAQVDESTGTVTLRAVFPNPDGVLLPGMYINTRLSQSLAENATLIPKTAVMLTPTGNAQVYVVGAENKIEVRPITTGGTMDGHWVVTGGLKTGDKVVVMGGAKVKPEQQVEVKLANQAPQEGTPPQGTPSEPSERAGQNSVLSRPAPIATPQVEQREQADSNAPSTTKAGTPATKTDKGVANSEAKAEPKAEPSKQPAKQLSAEEQELLDSADESN